MSATIFYIINILLFPITLIGFILQTIAVYGRRKSGVSVMAQAPLTDRWLQHKLGTRLDEPVNQLLRVLPDIPLLGYQLGYGPMLLAHRVSGYVPKSYRYPFAREINTTTLL